MKAPHRLRAPVLALAVTVATGLLGTTAPHAQEARYGDSTWVAPYPVAESVAEPTADGPRVAGRDRAPVGETILRTPFRIAALPFRIVARGLEFATTIGAPYLLAPTLPFGIRLPVAVISPTFAYKSNTRWEPGIVIHRPPYREDIPDVEVRGSWSTRDQRRASGRVRFGIDTTAFHGGFSAAYRFTPNRRFYGLGNSADEKNKSVFLSERGDLQSWFGAAAGPLRKLVLQAGLSGLASRRGYNESPLLEDRFVPATVPGFGRDTHVAWYGLHGEWAATNSPSEPSKGVHLRGGIRHHRSTDREHLRYLQWEGEVRGYVPVFADRRVIAMRAAYQAADPDAGSSPIPFDRLPSSTEDYRFIAYHNEEFRDLHIAVAQIEYRWTVTRDVQAFAVAQVGEVAPTRDRLRWSDIHESYGGGLRYNPPRGVPIRVQYAVGSEGPAFRLGAGGSF